MTRTFSIYAAMLIACAYFATGTNLVYGNTDSDNDAMPDDWEVSYRLDSTVNDAGLDHDNDGLSNLEEYM